MRSSCCTAPTAGGSRASCSIPGRWRCFSSRGPAFAAVEQLKEQGLTTLEAIDRIAGGLPGRGPGPVRDDNATRGESE